MNAPNTLRILLVEDHPFQLIAMEMHLNRLGFFHLTTAMDFAEATELLNAGKTFDVLLSDRHLRDGDGLELIKAAHAMGAIRHAILMSGLDNPSEIARVMKKAIKQDLPLRAFFSKPLCSQSLRQTLLTC